jgi:hypothetical protein
VRTETDAILSLQRLVNAALPDFVEVLTAVEDEQPARPFAVVSADDGWTPDPSPTRPRVTLPATVYAYVKGDTRKDARQQAEDAREALWHALGVGVGDGRPRLVPLFDYTGRPAVQQVAITGASSGTWTLEHEAGITGPLPLRAQPRDLRLALELLPGLAGNVWVYGKLGGPWAVRFDGELRGQPVEPLAVDVAGLAGPDPAAEIVELSAGSPDPWRDPRDFMTVEQPVFGGLADPVDPRQRTVTVGLRLTWGRGGRVPSSEMTLRSITARRA